MIYGTSTIWDDGFFGDSDIFAAEIYEPKRPIEYFITSQSSSQTNPDIDGHIIVWQDDRYGDWDIFGYNLTTDQEFLITDNAYDQTNPAINQNTVVFQDNRNGNWNIYAIILDGPEVAQCTSSIEGDVNGDCKVDLTDFALISSHWLECNLQPEQYCW